MSIVRKAFTGGKLGRINNYKTQKAQLLLDKYPGAGIAVSLKKLSSTYPGSCIRVRRSLDNDELDIGFTENELDISSLLSFVRNSSGFVTKLYGQEGKNRDFSQVNISLQPKIVSDGNLVTQNDEPSIYYKNSQLKTQPFNNGELVNAEGATSFFITIQQTAGRDSTTLTNGLYSGYTGTNELGLFLPWKDGRSYFEVANNINGGVNARLDWDAFSIATLLRSSSAGYIYKNNKLKAFKQRGVTFSSPTAPISIGDDINLGYPMEGYISDLIVYNFYQDNYEDITNELKSYYQIY